jgi:hypothetical protein
MQAIFSTLITASQLESKQMVKIHFFNILGIVQPMLQYLPFGSNTYSPFVQLFLN